MTGITDSLSNGKISISTVRHRRCGGCTYFCIMFQVDGGTYRKRRCFGRDARFSIRNTEILPFLASNYGNKKIRSVYVNSIRRQRCLPSDMSGDVAILTTRAGPVFMGIFVGARAYIRQRCKNIRSRDRENELAIGRFENR